MVRTAGFLDIEVPYLTTESLCELLPELAGAERVLETLQSMLGNERRLTLVDGPTYRSMDESARALIKDVVGPSCDCTWDEHCPRACVVDLPCPYGESCELSNGVDCEHCVLCPQKRWLASTNHVPRDDRITFLPGPHVYIIDGESDVKYISVTTLNHSLFPVFNAELVSQLTSRKHFNNPESEYYRKTPKEIADGWKANGQAASALGTYMHAMIEWYYNGFDIRNMDPPREDSVELSYFREFAKDHPHLRAFRTEWFIFDEDLRLAGSIDMVFFNEKTQQFCIYDWKRVLTLDAKKNKKGEEITPKWGTHPCTCALQDVSRNLYTLQLNVYRYILKTKYGMQVEELALVVLHPTNEGYQVVHLPIWEDTVREVLRFREISMRHGDDLHPTYLPERVALTKYRRGELARSELRIRWSDGTITDLDGEESSPPVPRDLKRKRDGDVPELSLETCLFHEFAHNPGDDLN